MKRVGLTGGIGSGKTTVAKLFELLGVPVYYADKEAKRLTDTDPRIVHAVKRLFGADIYINNELDRKKVASRVFSDKKLLNELSSIIHPVVKRDFENWCEAHSNYTLVIQEAAILFENGGFKAFDKMILVKAPRDMRIQRVMKRDDVSEKAVLERMNNQWDDERKVLLSDFLIECDEQHLVINQVLDIIKRV